ncbi:hypothetical protein BH09BAC2_BH09BAC2_19380 [soil metagenome]
MQQKKGKIDIVNIVLEECILAFPVSSFIISLYKQHQTRGSLSRKQLQGLYSKASGIKDIAPGKLAGIEAIIKKMPVRDKSALPDNKPMINKDEESGEMMGFILSKFPQHKRVLFLQSKFEKEEILSPSEKEEVKKFFEFANKKS